MSGPTRILSAFVLLAASAHAQRVITTIAGADWLFPGDGRPALNAPLSGAIYGLDIVADTKGNYFIADGDNFMVMRVGPDGIIHVVAGNGINFSSGDGALATNACLSAPTAIALDSQGNIYVAETTNRIRKITPDGLITTIAGTGDTGFAGDRGLATDAQFNQVDGLAVDPSGNVYISDTGNHRIRKVTTDGIITTIAGTGQPGSAGDNGPATSAQINSPARLALDSAGSLYIVEPLDPDYRIRKVDTHGVITTVAGGGANTGDGILATSAAIIPVAITVDSAGILYIADQRTSGVRKVDAQGRISTIAGGSGKIGFAGDGGRALSARFHFVFPSLTLDSAGNLLVADDVNERIRKITPAGDINTIAGNGLFHSSGNGGPATSASLDHPTGILTDSAGNIFITEPFLSRIRQITPDGVINIYAGRGLQGYSGDNGPATAASLGLPYFLATDPAGNLYFSDSLFCVIRKIDRKGIITTFAGNGNLGFDGDGGPALKAIFNTPNGIDFDSAGNLFIADSANNRIRMVSADGLTVSTLAGDGTPGFSVDNGPAQSARVNQPAGLRVYQGGIYFADAGNNRIRRIDLATHNITTVAGNGNPAFSGNGGPAVQAALFDPFSLTFDAAGNMYIADTSNALIRVVSPQQNISTFAGSVSTQDLNDGGPATAAGLGAPTDVAVDRNGNVLIVDQFYAQIRSVLAAAPAFQTAPANLAFTAPAGSPPIDQGVDIVGSISGVHFSASTVSSGWLQVSSTSGSMPATLRITANPSGLAAGPYQGTVTITADNAKPSSRSIPVALTVTAPGQPSLNVKPSSMFFPFVQQSPAVTRPLSVSNAGGGSLAFTATTSGGSWLTVSPASAALNAFTSATLNITANPAGLATGTYSGTITIASSSPAQSIVVPVTMTVSAVPQTILIPQTGLTFFTVQNGGQPPPQFFSILNTGVGQMPFTVAASTLSGGDWLFIFPANGTSDAASSIVPQIRIDVDPTGLASGIYYGTVQVSAPGADNNPQFVSIILNVLPPGSNIGAIVQPTALVFAGIQGQDSPGSQTVLVQNTGSTPVTFSSGRLTLDGKIWFTSVPTDGTVTAAQPARIVVQPRTQGLASGVYRGTLTLSFSDGNTRNIALVLVIVPPGSTLPSSSARQASTGSCKPTTLAPVFTLLASGFSIPAGFPGQVAVKVIDDCANAMTTGGVTVSFSNGDSPIRLTSLKDGTWAGTWTPVTATAQVTVTASAEVPDQNLKGTVQVKGGLQSSNAPPLIGDGAILNAASYALQAPIAPGGFIAIFGAKLADGLSAASTVPLPTTLSGSTILVAGRQAPLLFASDGQVNAMVPYGIAVNTAHQVAVSRGSVISVPRQVTIAAAAPGVFTIDGSGKGQGIIVGVKPNGDQAVADPTHPVTAGDVVVIYCTGLGEVTPPITAGNPASLTDLTYAVNTVTVTVGGVSAPVFFAGLTPGYAGLYQINATLAPGVKAGDQVPVVVTSVGQSSTPVTIAVR